MLHPARTQARPLRSSSLPALRLASASSATRSLAILMLAIATPSSAFAQENLTERYRDTAGRILGAALTDTEGWDKLTYLTTRIGHRLSGSAQLEQAIDWAATTMRREGLDNVVEQPVLVPHWVRGAESLEVLTPGPRALALLGLGGTVATPPEGVTAPVLVVGSFGELERRGRAEAEGKIVVFAVPWEGYGRTVQYRASGASRAAALGAVAALVRSATGSSLYTPHTGALRYGEGSPRIPAAAITVEDADWFRRMAAAGEVVTVRLRLEGKTLPDAPSANVIAEIRGSELPGEVVVMGGHFDSWDVGQGAHDDGAACVAAWQALRVIADLGLRPRRTLRVVLWTNEENGLAGARAYREGVGEAVSDHVAAIEMDVGAERPVGFGLGVDGIDPDSGDPRYEAAFVRLREIGALLDAIEAGTIERGGGGADIGPLMDSGVPGLSLNTIEKRYFDWHHTHADTLDKVDPLDLRRAIAALGVVGFVLADMPGRLLDEPASPGPQSSR